jgi:Ni,Fe-hydrogenase III large subunit
LLRGGVNVGGAKVLAMPDERELVAIGDQFAEIVTLARGQGTVMDRFTGTGVLDQRDVEAIGVLGVAARASGSTYDARRAHPTAAPIVGFTPAFSAQGDVLARFNVRVDEVTTSLDLLHDYCARGGTLDASGEGAVGALTGTGTGSGIVEGWRGAIVHRVEVDEGVLTRVKVVDPSFFNWPAVAVSLADTIVPDFPLVNKSFNLSYAGNDL